MYTPHKLFLCFCISLVLFLNLNNSQPVSADPAVVNETRISDEERMVFRSIDSQDGYIRESTEDSNVGLKTIKAGTIFRVGDDNHDRQYRAILSFNTALLPDTAVITWARLRIQRPDPCCVGWAGFGAVMFEIRSPYFGTSATLQPSDFQAPASAVLTGQGINVNEFETKLFGVDEFQYINVQGYTQIRFRLDVDDNDDMSADYVNYYSGGISSLRAKPTLSIEYHMP